MGKRPRGLLIIGIGAIAASLLLAVGGIAASRMSGWPNGSPGGMMGRAFGGGSGDIGLDRAVKIAQDAATSYPSGGLAADEVIEFNNNYYASIREKDTRIGAFEILIDRASGRVTREPGPDTMWNTKYSTTPGGMMGSFGLTGSEAMTVTAQQAQGIAQRWLDANQPGTNAKGPDSFHGYYTVDFLRSGQLVGMLSVNGYTGQVWFHGWHGTFIQVRDLGA
ncbi:MAG TPA: hypothetical protein VGS16_08875 [Candidatus Dormibacteraeota bacterium]|nr:hypothetical protein [Candidatus Dormibacteraeota bacterium]